MEKLSEDDELLGRFGDILAAVLSQDDDVLDAHAELSGQVNAGLGGDNGADRERIVVHNAYKPEEMAFFGTLPSTAFT